MTESDFNLFKRYLKERGLYYTFFYYAKKHSDRIKGTNISEIKKYILSSCHPTGALMDLITWSDTNRQVIKWSIELNLYKLFYECYKKCNDVNYALKEIKENELFYQII